MATMYDSAYGVSREAELDRTIEDLIGKTVAGSITPKERVTYNQALAQRSKLMSSGVFTSVKGVSGNPRRTRR